MKDPAALIESYLAGAGIEHASPEEGHWAGMLRGERKLTIPFSLRLRAGALTVESFFMRRPQENLDRFYDVLLRRNARAQGLAFALDGVGDVYLVGRCPVEGLTEHELDRILGVVLVESDGLFDACIEIGFASYLEADRRWREATGTPLAPPPGGA